GEVEHGASSTRRRGRLLVLSRTENRPTPVRPERPPGRSVKRRTRRRGAENCRRPAGNSALAGPRGRDYSGSTLMARPRLAAAFVAMGLTLAAVPAFADARSDS